MPRGVDGVSAYYAHAEGATLPAESAEDGTGLCILHRVIHMQLGNRAGVNNPRKSGQRKTTRHVKRRSNAMGHTNYKMPRGGGAPAYTNAHARPPELARYISATANWALDTEFATPRQPGVKDGLPTSDINPDASEPVNIITVNDRYLGYPYIEYLLREKGPD